MHASISRCDALRFKTFRYTCKDNILSDLISLKVKLTIYYIFNEKYCFLRNKTQVNNRTKVESDILFSKIKFVNRFTLHEKYIFPPSVLLSINSYSSRLCRFQSTITVNREHLRQIIYTDNPP